MKTTGEREHRNGERKTDRVTDRWRDRQRQTDTQRERCTVEWIAISLCGSRTTVMSHNGLLYSWEEMHDNVLEDATGRDLCTSVASNEAV